jgi:thioredoxin 1
MKDITATEFKTQLLEKSGFQLLDFYSKSCPPCRALGPVLEELQVEFENRIAFYKLDVAADDYKTATEYKVSSVPTLMIFANGSMVDRRTGGVLKSEIKKWIEEKIEQKG